MEISTAALESLEEEAFDNGFKKGREEIDYEWRLVAAQHKKLMEILEVEGDQTLMDAAEHLGAECRAHREAMKVAAATIERQRLQIAELRAEVAEKERTVVETGLWADRIDGANKLHIRELHNAVEPMQQTIKELNLEIARRGEVITELRQALLQHVTRTA